MEVASSNDYRQKIPIEGITWELLNRMVTEKKVLEPGIGGDGRVHYPFAEDLLGPEADTRAWIDDMVGLGILRASSTMEIVMCPTHLRADPIVQLECASCKNRSMKNTSLVEHIHCGFIGDDGRFKKDGVLQCPNCKRPIASADDLRVSGVWYECPNCLSKASSPRTVFVCREEKHDFSTNDLLLTPVNSYAVVESMISVVKSRLVLYPSLADMLKTLGFDVSYPASVKGQSGVIHSLDMYGRKDGGDIALQIAVDSKPVEASAVMSFFSKRFDIKPKFAILITIPSASEGAKQINTGYDIALVEDLDGSGAVQKVRALLHKQ